MRGESARSLRPRHDLQARSRASSVRSRSMARLCALVRPRPRAVPAQPGSAATPELANRTAVLVCGHDRGARAPARGRRHAPFGGATAAAALRDCLARHSTGDTRAQVCCVSHTIPTASACCAKAFGTIVTRLKDARIAGAGPCVRVGCCGSLRRLIAGTRAVAARLRFCREQHAAADRHFRVSCAAATALRQALVAWALLAQARASFDSMPARKTIALVFRVRLCRARWVDIFAVGRCNEAKSYTVQKKGCGASSHLQEYTGVAAPAQCAATS